MVGLAVVSGAHRGPVLVASCVTVTVQAVNLKLFKEIDEVVIEDGALRMVSRARKSTGAERMQMKVCACAYLQNSEISSCMYLHSEFQESTDDIIIVASLNTCTVHSCSTLIL